jgi:hypothetical protein
MSRSFNPPEPQDPLVCFFPKHKGKLWTDIIQDDPEYIEWLVWSYDGEIDEETYDLLVDLLENS